MPFNFSSIEHKLASVAGDIVKGARAVEHVLGIAASKAAVAEPTVELLTSMIDPAAVPLERGAFAALGLIAKAANDVDEAAAAKGVNIILDAQAWADFKAVYAVLSTRAGFLKP